MLTVLNHLSEDGEGISDLFWCATTVEMARGKLLGITDARKHTIRKEPQMNVDSTKAL